MRAQRDVDEEERVAADVDVRLDYSDSTTRMLLVQRPKVPRGGLICDWAGSHSPLKQQGQGGRLLPSHQPQESSTPHPSPKLLSQAPLTIPRNLLKVSALQIFQNFLVPDRPSTYFSLRISAVLWYGYSPNRIILFDLSYSFFFSEKETDFINPFLPKAPATKKNYNKVLWNPMPMASQMPPVARRSCYAP